MNVMKELGPIVERMQQGDRTAFGQFYSVCYERLRSICLHYVHNESVTDDLLHDAFLLMFSRIGKLKSPEKADAWVTTVMRNVCLLYLREQKLHATVDLNAVDKADKSLMENPVPMNYDEILHLVDQLPEGYARVFRLSVLEGMNHQQIAILLGIEPHTSSSQLYRAKQALRRMLIPLLLMFLAAIIVPLISPDRETTVSTIQEEGQANAKADSSTVQSNVLANHERANVRTNNMPTGSVLADLPSDCEESQPIPCDSQIEKPDTCSSQMTCPVELPVVSTVKPAEQHTRREVNRWALALAYSGMSNPGDSRLLPYADAMINAGICDTLTRHYMPLTLSLSLRYQLSDHWQVGTGIEYTRLKSETRIGNSFAALHQDQTVQYLGIPLSLSWNQPLGRHLHIYSTAGLSLHLPLRSTVERVYWLDGSPVDPATERLHPGMMWSIDVGLGAEYQLTPYLHLFLEPRLHHYFNNGNGVDTWNTTHPVTFSLPFGLRISWPIHYHQ